MSSQTSAPSELDLKRTKQVLSKLHSLVNTVATNLDHHTTTVEATSRDLISLSRGDDMLDDVVRSVNEIVKSNRELQAQLLITEQKLGDQRQQIESYLNKAHTDFLTGLPNRRALDENLRRQFSQWQRLKIPFSVVIVDLDDFKAVNDTYGHLAGDAVLQGTARVIAATLRDMDIVCRYGGEEFLVLLPGTTSLGALNAAERIRALLAASRIAVDDHELEITASAGVAEALREDDRDTLLRRADLALYRAKHDGKNRVHVEAFPSKPD